jgi:5-methylcytosine-specific restriction endonuclease McrA
VNINIRKIPKSAIIGAIRQLFARSALCKQVRINAVDPNNKGPRGGKLFICKHCGTSHAQKNTNVDHDVPVIPLNSSAQEMSLDVIVDRMWCDMNNLQVLCKECHDKKTKAEVHIRKLFKRGKKTYIKRKEKE